MPPAGTDRAEGARFRRLLVEVERLRIVGQGETADLLGGEPVDAEGMGCADDEVFDAPDNRDPAWDYERRELGVALGRAIAQLREPQRSLVLLFDVQGMSVAECAQIVGINANQVKVYLHRARRRLRLELEGSR